jgi:hypothetical protein
VDRRISSVTGAGVDCSLDRRRHMIDYMHAAGARQEANGSARQQHARLSMLKHQVPGARPEDLRRGGRRQAALRGAIPARALAALPRVCARARAGGCKVDLVSLAAVGAADAPFADTVSVGDAARTLAVTWLAQCTLTCTRTKTTLLVFMLLPYLPEPGLVKLSSSRSVRKSSGKARALSILLVYCELHNNRPKPTETSAIRVS